jgi:nitroreductase
MKKDMNRREFLKTSATGMVLAGAAGSFFSPTSAYSAAKELQTIQLVKPQSGASGFLQLLEKRSSSREFSPEPLPIAVLSNLLWAACGINRPDGHRTAPTANNRQDIDIYVATAEGLYLYDAKANALKPVLGEDIRALTGTQPFVKDVPVNLVFVSDYTRLSGSDEQKAFYSGAHTGYISENVYLYCAAEGLATVVRAMIDRPRLATAMKLRADQRITLSQSVGYPKKKG